MVTRAVLLALLALALAAPAASAHARLESTSPERGATVAAQPRAVVFRFDEPVEATFGAVRVFDARGARVDEGAVTRPGGHQDEVGAALKAGLARGTYTATYRVVSADGHPVSGGFTFNVGSPGAAPSRDVSSLLEAGGTGPVTEVAFGAVKALGYLAIAIFLGGLGFLAFVWPGAAGAAGDRFAARARTLVTVAIVLGLATSLAGLVLQGAIAAGTSAWSALDPTVVREVAGTHAGTGWALRLGDWALLAVVLCVATALGSARWLLLAPGLFLAVTPALAGHASAQDPVWALFALDVVHVLAMSAWLGGLVVLVVCLPAATRVLDPPERTRLLSATLTRFSPLALGAVALLAATGATQAILEIRHLDALTGSPYGRAVLIKSGLLLLLVGLGAVNRQRVVPALRRLAASLAAPGGVGRLLRRTLRAEVAVVLVMLGVTGALTGYPPPVSEAQGPQSVSKRMGPLDLELTVDPAQVGVNQLHVYLFRARDGTPFTGTKELIVRLSQPDKGIGPLDARMRRGGPGHFIADSLTLSPGGTWRIEITDRVSDFDQYATTATVNVR